ncbi:DUF4232 domain-containing protein [Saccharopolyspora taberi]|uniref:DUF4232 domain-containing protein n=1 Tax=Saccharopolyspora taberi TaxID=60895 RepID=A0ABN3VC82_9PSEU
MSKRRNLRGAGVLAGAAVLAGLAFGGAAQAMPGDHPDFERYCTPEQVDVAISPLDHAMGKTGGDVSFTAKPGQSCLLNGSPVLTFRDAAGQPLGIGNNTPGGPTEPIEVSEGRPGVATFSFRTVDMNTGEVLHGPTPASVEVALPAPVGAYTVELPWDSKAEVPGPVDVTPVISR